MNRLDYRRFGDINRRMGKKLSDELIKPVIPRITDSERDDRAQICEASLNILRDNKMRLPKRAKTFMRLFVNGYISQGELSVLLNSKLFKP